MELLKDVYLTAIKEAPKGYYLLKVAQVKPLTKEAVQIVFDIPVELRETFEFIPGQHVDLILNDGDEDLHRSYSICSGPGEPLSIGVKALPDGRVSRFLTTKVKSGDILTVSSPRGSFNLDDKAHTIVLIGAGSGITPLLSMLRKSVEASTPVTLLYGNRTSSSIMFYDEIAELPSAKVIHFLSGEQRDGFNFGRIDRANMFSLGNRDPSLLKADAYYLCGPEPMVVDVREALLSSGVSADRIHLELFTTPTTSPETELKSHSTFTGRCAVRVKLEGDKYQFEVDSDGPVLLEAARKAGLDAPYSCKTGICGSCRAKVLNGSVEMMSNYALTADELAQGYILTCQARPTCSEISISYDD